ncbi:nitrilase family protein [Apibacter raozihei]|uniref:nitrilase-related carbon-nitrogen hydrolase n=1 Tax=Apibacter raozihei TaxID=2500547 RepID=UPI000FE421C4|nr:nitrilase-related carbon-nitrogen hydrolase [Apibacter raozihei]
MLNKNNLSLTLVEFAPEWENADHNLNFLSRLLLGTGPTDIIVLPEMFNTGFSMNSAKIAECMNGKTVNWMKEFSLNNSKAICGSIAVFENYNYFNRFIFVNNGEICACYDKHHLFSYGGENRNYSSGSTQIYFNFKGWKIFPTICYDLRFPIWNRNTENYDLLLNVASWPDNRIDVWDTLLKARAIENMSYVCGVNRIGTDFMNLNYSGHSSVVSPTGTLLKLNKINNFLFQQLIEKSEIHLWRNKYKFLDDRDSFKWI